jgi:ribosome-associated toxin RatA of RatAB toxin-antitoxin module
MKRVRVEVTGQTAASPSTVYEVAKDSSEYPHWSRIGSFEHVRSGSDEPYGVGSVRIFRTWPIELLEEVVELVPERRVAYIVHRGLPFRDYRADIDLTPGAGGGTTICWHCDFHAKVPGTGFLCRAFMRRVLAEMVPALAAEAERIERSSTGRGNQPVRSSRLNTPD